MTQKDRVIQRLQEQEWLSTVDMINDPVRRTIRLGDVIFKLRRAGYVIQTRDSVQSCGEYKLISLPENPKKECGCGEGQDVWGHRPHCPFRPDCQDEIEKPERKEEPKVSSHETAKLPL